MAISWGSWEYSGGNGMRVGIDVSWESVGHNEGSATATVKYYTENQNSYSDSQKLNFSGAIDGSTSFNNNAGGAVTLRATRTYTYTYGGTEYGSSPGKRTFTARLTGAFNGVTPSKSVTSSIPKRPYGAPNPPTNVSASRVSDSSAKITWTNKETYGRPWDRVYIAVDVAANDVWNGSAGTAGGGSSSFTHSGLSTNQKYRWRVRSENSIGNSAFFETGVVWTPPATPSAVTRTGDNGENQVIQWNNNTSYNEYLTEVWVRRDGVWAFVTAVPNGVSSYTHTEPASNPAVKYAYRLRTVTTRGDTLRSSFSATTTETTGSVSPPARPTNVSPDDILLNPASSRTFSWTYNSTDASAQTAFQIRWRESGSTTWTYRTKTNTSAASTVIAGGTFPNDTQVEWQVQTWGAHATGSGYSASATFTTTSNPSAIRTNRRPVILNTDTGEMETAFPGVLPPVGSVFMFAATTPPDGWLACNGQAVSRTTYADLFTVIGTAYGAGNGSTTFNLPNLTDRFPMGGTPGETGGASSVTLETTNLPPHQHDMSHGHGGVKNNSDGGSQTTWRAGANDSNNVETSAGSPVRNYEGNTGTGSAQGLNSTPFSIVPPFLGFTFIIKT